jgi:hypothetical protein
MEHLEAKLIKPSQTGYIQNHAITNIMQQKRRYTNITLTNRQLHTAMASHNIHATLQTHRCRSGQAEKNKVQENAEHKIVYRKYS